MKKMAFLGLLLVAVIASNAMADVYILVPETDWTGSRTVGSGVTGNPTDPGYWGAIGGFTISWEISYDQNEAFPYTYSYTITDAAGGELTGGPSHFIFEVSKDFTLDKLSIEEEIEGPKNGWMGNPSNPNMPADFFGIKIDVGSAIYEFSTKVAPIWGDFYSKDGKWGEAWNTGIGTDPVAGVSFINWIPVPDTTSTFPGPTPIPEPTSIALLGIGLVGIGIAARMRRK